MAIMQQYRGNEDDWDVTKMKPGQFAVSLDRKYVRMCFAPGVAEKMALYDAFEEDMLQIQQILATCEDIQVAVEAFEVLAQQHANAAEASATASANSATESAGSATLSESWAVGGTGSRTGEDTNNAEYWAGVAQSAANVEIMTPTKLGIGKPDNITIGVNNGTFETKFKNYTSLEDLGLTTPKTCLEIATAMSNGSRITLAGYGNNVVSDTPEQWGIVTITRRSPAYVAAEFTSFGAGKCNRYVRSISTTNPTDSSGWIDYLTTSKLTDNLLATVPGTALDAVQGKALDDKVSDLNSKLDMSGSHTVYTVFGTNSGSSVATGFIPFHNAIAYNINITAVGIPGVAENPPTTALEVVGRSKSGINLRAISTYAANFKGNTAFITFTAVVT